MLMHTHDIISVEGKKILIEIVKYELHLDHLVCVGVHSLLQLGLHQLQELTLGLAHHFDAPDGVQVLRLPLVLYAKVLQSPREFANCSGEARDKRYKIWPCARIKRACVRV